MAHTLTELERRPSLNLRQLLTRSTRVVNERIVAALRARGFPDARVAHSSVLANLELRGSTVTEIASCALLPKQAISKMVELEEFGYLERSLHDSDGRAVFVRFTRKGRKLMTATFDVIAAIEYAAQARLGPRRYAALRSSLLLLLDDDVGRGD
ncbi:MAG: MarR family transcriptional regulator [Candidatus Eremiobacteraeota bacterium]|nr:MarR family transcriptional regulator [Candidatus Eremiobacteraeota bacterium]